MNLSEAIQINYELAELAIQQIENSNFLVRWQNKDLMDKLREIQLKSDEFLLTIQQTRRSMERNISMLQISEPLDPHYWTRLLDSMQLYEYVLSRVEEENVPLTKVAIERINDQLILFQQSIQPQVVNYNVLVQELRRYRSRPLYLNSILIVLKTGDLPVVLNASKLTTFLNLNFFFMTNICDIPVNKLPSENSLIAKKERFNERLVDEHIRVTLTSIRDLNLSDEQPLTAGSYILIPPGKLALDDDALKKKREELKKKLLEGQKIVIGNDGNVSDTAENANTGNKIQIPPGKLASFYWYDKDPQLLQEEVAAMKHFFGDNFQLDKLDDGRLFWYGTLNTGLLGSNDWHLQLVYDNNHPSNNSYGGSVKVYLVSPDIHDLQQELGVTLPHVLSDAARNLYLCTAERGSFHASKKKSTSAASCLSWAVKWIAVCEMYIGGEVTYDEFANHGKF